MQVLKRVFERRNRMTTAPALEDFMAARAAFIVQKCAIEYCRLKGAQAWDKLLREKPFLDALEVCRWEGFVAVLSDLCVVVEGYLRDPAARAEADLVGWLHGAAGRIVDRYPLPSYRDRGWADELDELRRRVSLASLAPPRPVHEIAKVSGRLMYHRMPIHTSLTGDDLPVVRNNVRFNMCRAYDDMQIAMDVASTVIDMRLATAPSA